MIRTTLRFSCDKYVSLGFGFFLVWFQWNDPLVVTDSGTVSPRSPEKKTRSVNHRGARPGMTNPALKLGSTERRGGDLTWALSADWLAAVQECRPQVRALEKVLRAVRLPRLLPAPGETAAQTNVAF